MTHAEELAIDVLKVLTQEATVLVPGFASRTVVAALTQYAYEVKEAAARECERIGNKTEDERPNKYLGDSALDCAQAIRGMKLP